MISGPKRRLSSGYRVQKRSFSRCMLIPRTHAFMALLSLHNEGNHRSYNERRPLPLGWDYPSWRTSSGPSSVSGAIKNRGSLGGAAVWRLPLAQGAILETWDRIPCRAPGAWSLLLPLPMSLPLSLSLSLCDNHK